MTEIENFADDIKTIIKAAQICKDEFLSAENYRWLWNSIDDLVEEYKTERAKTGKESYEVIYKALELSAEHNYHVDPTFWIDRAKREMGEE